MKCDLCPNEESDMFSPDLGGLNDQEQIVAEIMNIDKLDVVCSECFYELLEQRRIDEALK